MESAILKNSNRTTIEMVPEMGTTIVRVILEAPTVDAQMVDSIAVAHVLLVIHAVMIEQ